MRAPIRVHIITPQLTPHEQFLRDVIDGALQTIGKKLPLHELDIVVVHSPLGVIPETGTGAQTAHSGLMYIYLDIQRPRFREEITEDVPLTLAHELHHAARGLFVSTTAPLLAAVVAEGLADHFTGEVFGTKPPPWSRALRSEEIEPLLQRIRDVLDKNDDRFSWLYGSDEANVPKWTGYTLGYEIVRRYLTVHLGATATSLVHEPTESFRPFV